MDSNILDFPKLKEVANNNTECDYCDCTYCSDLYPVDPMPATNYGWCIQDPHSVFQGWGSKRKYPDTEEPESKRHCVQLTSDNGYNMTPMAEDSMQCDGDRDRSVSVPSNPHEQMCLTETRVPELHPVHSYHQTQHILHPSEHTSNNITSINNDFSHGAHITEENNNSVSSQMCFQNTMIMDLHDECYSTALLPENITTDAEYEAACNMVAVMESEGGPDPYQYRYSHANSTLIDRQSHDQSSETMQPSGRLSLGQHDDVRPYISDVY